MKGMRFVRELALCCSLCLAVTGMVVPLGSTLAHADPAPLLATPDPMPAPLGPAQRIPDPAPVPQLGDPSPGVTDVTTGDAATPQEAIANLLATGGGGSVRLFSESPGAGTHVAFVQPGSKADFTQLSRSGAGWTGALAGATVFFPRHLATDSGIGFSVPQGQMVLAPEGISKTTGQEHPVAINYTAAEPYTDYIYSLASGGYKEEVDLTSPEASPVLSWLASSAQLSLSLADGGIVISSGATQVAAIGAPLIQDARGTAVVGTWSLAPVSSGITRVSLQIPPDFLAQAVYPVAVDPGAMIVHPLSDTYVDQASPSTSFENQTSFQVSSKLGEVKRSFLRFDTSSLKRPGRLVYQADLMAHASATGTRGDITVEAQAVTSAWPPRLTWNNQPTAGATIATATAYEGTFSTFHLQGLYQGYLGGTSADYGVRLSSSNTATFDSSETPGDLRPALILAFNDLPAAAVAAGPQGALETIAPVLQATGIPIDPNGDQVMLRFEVSDDPNFDANMLAVSNWSPETSYQVQPGVLSAGNYYWRIRSRDVCDISTGALCSLTDGAGVIHAAATSEIQQIEISPSHLGEGGQMTTQQLGNNISVGVNDANGNLYIDMTFDTRSSPLGDLGFGLAYNSMDPTDQGLGAGWRVWAGPPGELPLSIRSAGTYLVMRLADGSSRYFSERFGGSEDYLSIGAGTGQVTRGQDGSFAYESDAGSYYFDRSGYLSALRYAGTTPARAAAGAVLTYSFGEGHLQSVSDPGGNAVHFIWVDGSLDRVTAGGATFDVTASSSGISVTDPAGETFQALSSGGLVYEIRDGATVAGGAGGWDVGYTAGRVSTLGAPGQPPWRFEYSGPFHGDLASVTYVTDPRGTAGIGDFEVMYDFNRMGEAIREVGPADQDGHLPVSTMLFDANANLICSRSPEANAIELQLPSSCGKADDLLATDELSSTYRYSSLPPYRMTSEIQAAPVAGGMGADFETFLDSGVASGPAYKTWANLDLSAAPRLSGVWNSPLAHDYGSSAPAGITTGSWAMSFAGYITNPTSTAKNYIFRFYAQDGVDLVVADTKLLSCFGQSGSASAYNCASNEDASILLPPGSWPMSIRYGKLAARRAQASFDFRWNGGAGSSLTTIQPSDFAASLGLPSSSTQTAGEGSSLQTDQSFPGTAQITRLASSVTQSTSGSERVDEMTYDDLGRLTSETLAAGSPAAATTTYSYADRATGCVTHEQLPSGAAIDRICDLRGNVTFEQTSIPATYDQPAQLRTTETTYDAMGRVLSETSASGGVTSYSYDASGRVISQDQLLDSFDDLHGLTSYSYDAAGRMISQAMPDGGVVNHTYDAVGNELSSSDPRDPTWLTTTQYDAQNRVIRTTTPSGLVSSSTYVLSASGFTQTDTDAAGVATITKTDAAGQVVSTRTGSLAPTTYRYDVSGNQIRTTDPSGVITRSHYDGFADLVSTDTLVAGSLTRITTYAYDAAGNETSVDGPLAGGTVSFTWDGSGRLTSVTQQALAAPNTTHYSYDAAGELVRVAQPMNASQTQVRTFSYDEAGNQVTSSDARGTTTSIYDEADRLTQKDLPNGYTLYYEYDAAGRQIIAMIRGNGFNPTYQRRTRPHWSCRACAVHSAYDLAGNLIDRWRDGFESLMSYDEDGRITDVASLSGDVTSYVYGPTGKLDSLSTAAGETSYSYGANGELETLTDPFTNQATTYSYDDAGRLIARTDPSGMVLAQGYEASTGLVSSRTIKNASGDTLASFALSYDAAGDVVSRSERIDSAAGGQTPGSGMWSYSYDPAGRMTSATAPSGKVTTYGYDNAGNRTSVQINHQAPITTTYDDAGLATSSTDGVSYLNDAAGNLIGIDAPGTDSDRCFFFDGLGLLHSVGHSATGCSRSSGEVFYYNDGFGRPAERSSSIDGSYSANYYEGTSSDITGVETTVSGLTTDTYFASSPDGPLAQQDPSGVRFLIQDLHGDLVGTASAGAVTGSVLYSPWGEPQDQSGDQSILGFQSQPTDADTGFVKTDTRWLDPAQGRFTTQDSLFGDTRSPAGMNQFGYVEGNPVSSADNSGMACGISKQAPVRNQNNPWVYACVLRPFLDPDDVVIRGTIDFKHNDKGWTRWFKITVNLEELSNDTGPSWSATNFSGSTRWCTPSGAGCRVPIVKLLGDNTPTTTSRRTSDGNWVANSCGKGTSCFRAAISRIEIWDKGRYWDTSYSRQPRPFVSPGIP
jgi:RHS repeat-associated protein